MSLLENKYKSNEINKKKKKYFLSEVTERTDTIAILGNEAIAYGLLDGGIKYAAAYPGTPSTEIMEQLQILVPDSPYITWSSNEAVAFEEVAAASITGTDAAFICKSVGLNVAMDPIMTVAFSGINAACIIIVADDPAMLSSQNEQDNRITTQLNCLPMFEPSTVQECYDFAREAILISRKFQIPVFIRSVTRVSHALGVVERRKKQILNDIEYKAQSERFVNIPANARKNHVRMLRIYDEIYSYVQSSSYFNEVVYGEDPDILIISSGSSANYVLEAIEFLKLECTVFIPKIVSPLPENRIIELVVKSNSILIIEELEPFLENKIRILLQKQNINVDVIGKNEGLSKRNGELTTDLVTEYISKCLKLDYLVPQQLDASSNELIKIRPPVLCAGCPHRSTYVLLNSVLKKYKPIYCNDIGCYSLGVLPPHKTADILLCMGASIPMATSVSFTQPDRIAVAIIGDSTFWHTGLSGLANAIWKNANIIVFIMDNRTTAMTGNQPNPSSINKLDIAKTTEAMGAWTRVINPMDYKKSRLVVKEALEVNGVKVIVSDYPCALNISREILQQGEQLPLAEVDVDACNGCGLCINPIGCPALSLNDNNIAEIDQSLSVGCMYCAEHCRHDAIKEESR